MTAYAEDRLDRIPVLLARALAAALLISATVWPVWIVTEAAIRSVGAAGRWVARIVR